MIVLALLACAALAATGATGAVQSLSCANDTLDLSSPNKLRHFLSYKTHKDYVRAHMSLRGDPVDDITAIEAFQVAMIYEDAELSRMVYCIQTASMTDASPSFHAAIETTATLASTVGILVAVHSDAPSSRRTLPANVMLLDARGMSWNAGRNMLVTRALYIYGKDMEYLTLADDNAFASLSCRLGPTFGRALPPDVRGHKRTAVCRTRFETHIAALRPAYAAINAKRSECLSRAERMSGPYVSTRGIHEDAMYNVFHRNTIARVLPYATAFDSETWWASQVLLGLRLACHYGLTRKTLSLPYYVDETANTHAPYPRAEVNFSSPQFIAHMDHILNDPTCTFPVE